MSIFEVVYVLYSFVFTNYDLSLKLETPEGASSVSVRHVPSEHFIFARNFENLEISLGGVAPVQATTRKMRFSRFGEELELSRLRKSNLRPNFASLWSGNTL